MPRVLIIEDDEDIRDAIAVVVERQGCEPVAVSHGLDALRYLSDCNRLPSVILLDLMVPVMDGWGFLRRRDRAVPISGAGTARRGSRPHRRPHFLRVSTAAHEVRRVAQVAVLLPIREWFRGGARVSQAEGRRFESGTPLKKTRVYGLMSLPLIRP